MQSHIKASFIGMPKLLSKTKTNIWLTRPRHPPTTKDTIALFNFGSFGFNSSTNF